MGSFLLEPAAVVNDPRPLAIAKLMLAVAWANEKLGHDDVLKIRKYLNNALRMTEEDTQAFNLYQEYPIETMERRRLARRFAHKYNTVADRKEVSQLIDSLAPQQGQHLAKTMAIQEIKEALVEDQINLIKKVKYKLTRTPFPAKISDLGREVYLGEYTRNPLLFRLKVRYGDNFTALKLSYRKVEKLSLELSLVGLVIYADQILLPEELALITEYLQHACELSEEQAETFVTMALCRECSPQQIPQFCVRYLQLSTFEERHQLYLLLGKLAQVDHHVSKEEEQVLEKIAEGLCIAIGVRRSVLGASPETVEV